MSGVSAVSAKAAAPVEEAVAKEAKAHGMWFGQKMKAISDHFQSVADSLKSDGSMMTRKHGGHNY